MITNNDKGGNEIVVSGKIIDENIVKDTTNIKIKQHTFDKAPDVLDNNKSDQSNNASEGDDSMITNNDKGGNEVIASRKITDEEIAKDTKQNTIKQNTVRTPISVAKAPNVLETRAEEKENAISCLFKQLKRQRRILTSKY